MYEYNDQFNLTDKLAQTVTNILRKKENTDYLCKVISITIPEHEELVLSEPIVTHEYWGEWPNINTISKTHQTCANTTILEKEYTFLVVMKSNAYQHFSKLSFKNKKEMNKALEHFCVIFIEYDGIFNSNIFKKKFPYLEDFFTSIDEWRTERKRVTIDDNILQREYAKVLNRKSKH